MENNLNNIFEKFTNEYSIHRNPLNSTPTLEVLGRLEKYKKTDLKRIKEEELFNITMDTIPCCNVGSIEYKEGMRFFRIREYFGENYTSINQLLYAPSEFVTRMGRLNNIGQSILYVSKDPVTPFYELKATVGNAYTVICYEVKEKQSLLAYIIGGGTYENDKSLTEQGKINSKIIDQFFYSEFTKDVLPGQEHLYKITNMLAKNFFDMPGCEAYEYPSVALNRNPNLAIKPQAVDEKLKIVSVENIRVIEINENEVRFDMLSYATNISSSGVEYLTLSNN